MGLIRSPRDPAGIVTAGGEGEEKYDKHGKR
jgi:hypothetical protein